MSADVDDSFDRAIAAFDQLHADDSSGHALRYHETLARFVSELAPGASEALRLAAHCQHLHRDQLPRSEYPPGVLGYKRWRSELARRHADEARKILIVAGFAPELGERVGDFLQKKRLKSDPEVQVFENAICLTFLALELGAFAAKHSDEKVIDILRKTWAKMSEAGHAAALVLAASLPPRELGLVQRALQ